MGCDRVGVPEVREYGRVHSAFWSSPDIQVLSDDGRMLALYLLTCTHGTIAGAFRLPDGYVSEDIGWDPGRVSKAFLELLDKGFSNRCETTKWVWVRRFLHWNAPENPNQWKAVFKVVGQIPEKCSWRTDFERELTRLSTPGQSGPSEPSENGSKTLSKSQPNTTAPQQQQHQELRSKKAAARPPPALEWTRFRLTFPARAGSQPWGKALKAINARLAEGHTWDEIIAGAQRYADFIVATGKLNTEYTMQAVRFVGPEKPFLETWAPPASKADTRLRGNLSAAEEFMRRTEAAA